MNHDIEKIYRSHHEKKLWTRFGTVLLGFWLLTSPATFGYLQNPMRINDWICGLLLVFFGLFSMSFRFRWWIWGSCLVGIWLQFAPLVFWADESVIYLNDTLIGVLAIAFCVLVPLRPEEFDLGPEIPPGWSYNPSSWQQRLPVIFLAVVAWFLARYLASEQLHYISSVFDPFFGQGSNIVINSMISQEFPVSDAGLGAMAYSLEAIMGAKGSTKRWHTMPWIVCVFGFLVVPVGFVSIILVMLQPIAVGAWCGICLLIAACMLIMLTLTVDEVVAVVQFLRTSVREGKPFWKTFFYGSSYIEKGIDTRTPGFHSSAYKIIAASFWGVTWPWYRFATVALGVWLLFARNILGYSGFFANSTDVAGALIITFSIISFAEVIRAIRLLIIPIGLWLAFAPWFFELTPLVSIHSLIIGILAILLALPRGCIKEHYGRWNRAIF